MFGCDQDGERLEQKDNIDSEIYLKNNPTLKNAIMEYVVNSLKSKSCIDPAALELDNGFVIDLGNGGKYLLISRDNDEFNDFNLFYYCDGAVVFAIDETYSASFTKSTAECQDKCYDDLQKKIKEVTKEYKPLRIIWKAVDAVLGEAAAQRACHYECRPR